MLRKLQKGQFQKLRNVKRFVNELYTDTLKNVGLASVRGEKLFKKSRRPSLEDGLQGQLRHACLFSSRFNSSPLSTTSWKNTCQQRQIIAKK